MHLTLLRELRLKNKKLEKYPQLKAPPKNVDQIIQWYAMKSKIPNENFRHSYLRQKTEIRPLFYKLTPHGATNARSPLISLIFPSMKDKIRVFEEESKKRNSSKGKNRSMMVKPSELDQIIEEESLKKKKKNLNTSAVDDYI